MDESVVVSPDWLATRLEDAGVAVVDVRDAWEYDGIGHVPGAVNVPFESYRDETADDPGTLPGRAAFGDLLGEVGIEPEDTIVAYDDSNGVFAARFRLTALAYGHDDVRLLDGDFSAWSRERETETGTPSVEATAYTAEPFSFAESPFVDRSGVEAAIEGDAVLVDTRDREEYAEAHLPGAVRFDWRATVDDESRRLRPVADLEELFADRGIIRDREIVLYCNTARRISHTYAVLEALGYENVSIYEGSLTEWLATDGEIETGSPT
ncbi:sulfurtransferase [Natronococcus occultus]|uniref:Rhodanese-related sulfurtransferase n=1 Tax=Natronococcus occultus SP4 TaxID=694430 RepID=L0JVW2_9EURY|nr:sulfurtransferase [Natronococcus occultus]AGB36003.1 rhodanese-related sulfurtransferase [Natronococcus occultus SP4]